MIALSRVEGTLSSQWRQISRSIKYSAGDAALRLDWLDGKAISGRLA